MELTYYLHPDPKISFSIVANHHIASLIRSGIKVHSIPLSTELNRIPLPRTEIAIVHPLFYAKAWPCISFEEMMSRLSMHHPFILGVEVADGTQISPALVSWANDPRLCAILLPSRFSANSFINAGVFTEIQIFPHAYDVVPASDRFLYLSRDNKPVILCFFLNDFFRKGQDQVGQLVQKNPDKIFVFKTNQPHVFRELSHLPNVTLMTEWLSESDLTSLYQNCDILLSLHRGGAFELNCLEALINGMIVMAPRKGAVLDYLTDCNSRLINISNKVIVHPHQNDHCGEYYHIDIDHANQELNSICSDLENQKSKIKKQLNNLRKKHSWDVVCMEMIQFLKRKLALGSILVFIHFYS